MRGRCLTAALFGMLISSSGSTDETAFSVPSPPILVGTFHLALGNKCSELSGSFVLLGKPVSGRVSSPMDLELESVLGAPYLQVAYDPANKLYADISLKNEAHQLNVEIFAGPRSVKWSTQDYTCEQGWLKLSRYSAGGSEGNKTKVNITSFMRKNTAGDLVVFRTVKGRTSNLFSLVWSNIDDEDWLVFKQAN